MRKPRGKQMEPEPYRLRFKFDRGIEVPSTIGRQIEGGVRTLRVIYVNDEPWAPIRQRDNDVMED